MRSQKHMLDPVSLFAPVDQDAARNYFSSTMPATPANILSTKMIMDSASAPVSKTPMKWFLFYELPYS